MDRAPFSRVEVKMEMKRGQLILLSALVVLLCVDTMITFQYERALRAKAKAVDEQVRLIYDEITKIVPSREIEIRALDCGGKDKEYTFSSEAVSLIFDARGCENVEVRWGAAR